MKWWLFAVLILSGVVPEKPKVTSQQVCEDGVCYVVIVQTSKE
jgi:hypothetical protein